jgi:hypothetical protein
MSNPAAAGRLQVVYNPIPVEDTMKYLCLIYADEVAFASLPKDELDALRAEFMALSADLKANGNYLSGSQLQPTSAATTVRIRGGKLSTTDGPFAETKEQLGGFYLIEAADLNAAIQIAAKLPVARFGSIEVRPLVQAAAQAAG